jgi:integrase
VKYWSQPDQSPLARVDTPATPMASLAKVAGLPHLHVHDLRHTVGMRLREAGLPESTVADILWQPMTRHYSMAQIVELHGEDQGRYGPLEQDPGF